MFRCVLLHCALSLHRLVLRSSCLRDFLLYKDSDGKYADFHALRHTFITNLCKANVSPKTAQALACHCDISLTMNFYSHVDLEEQAAAIGRLQGV